MNPMSNTILVYEDNEHLRDSIVSLLGSFRGFSVVGSWPDCLDVIGQVRSLNPDIVLMDIDLPGMTGIEAVKKIRQFNTTTCILMLTVFDDNVHVYDAICAGASGYLLKRHIAEKLTSSIQEVLAGGAPMSPSIARMVIQSMQNANKLNSDPYLLTAREKEILSSLSKGNSYKLIASELEISLDTVRTHIKHIYDKLQVHSQTEAVSKAINERLV
jgi:DNA-binding NarL/FixJ family response regulator